MIQVLALSRVPQTVLGILVITALFPWAAWLERRDKRRVAPCSERAPAITDAPVSGTTQPEPAEAGLATAG